MFHPLERPMERGWVGRVDGDRVVHLAAQTLQSFFTGGGTAREHAEYPLAGVRLLAPVLHPPSIRVFESETSFAFANPAAVIGPGAAVPVHRDLAVLLRLAAIVGAEEEVAGFTLAADWRRTSVPAPKDRDFALGLGPVVATPDELVQPEAVVRVDWRERRGAVPGFRWAAARELAAAGTRLYPGDLLVGPPALGPVEVRAPATVELEVEVIGTLGQAVLRH
jgi:hypothetical protein